MEIINHYCFKCGKPFKVMFPIEGNEHSNPTSCPTCGFFKCPACNSCKCSLNPEAQKAVEAFYDSYCSSSCGKRRRT